MLAEDAQSRRLWLPPHRAARVAPGGNSTRPGWICAICTLNLVPCRTRFSTTGSTLTRGKFGSRFSRRIIQSANFPARATSASSSSLMAWSSENSPDRRPRNFRKMRATAEFLSHIVRQRPNVRAGRTLDDKPRDAGLQFPSILYSKSSTSTGFNSTGCFLRASSYAGRPFTFFAEKMRRAFARTGRHALRESFSQRRRVECRRGVRSLCFAIRIVSIRREAEPESRRVALSASVIKLHEPRGASEQQHQTHLSPTGRACQDAQSAESPRDGAPRPRRRGKFFPAVCR